MIGARTLSRYLLRETAAAWAAVLAVLLLVMLASRSVRFLTAAAEGSIPPDLVAQVVLLSGMQYLMLITPISLLLGVMLAMGRLYKDQEITAATACGVGLGRLAQPFVVLAVIAALFTAMLSLDLGPRAGRAVDQLTQEAREQLSYAPFESGRFSSMAGGDAVFYAERARDGGTRFETVFIHADMPEFSGTVVADSGSQRVLEGDGAREIALRQGKAYQQRDGALAWDIVSFEGLVLRLMPPPLMYTPSKTKIESTPALLERGDAEAMAEFHWRISAPVAVLLMVLIAVPLSHVGPRQGRYSKLVLGLLVYLVYANLLGAGQTALERGMLPMAAGLWPVHALALAAGIWLCARRAGRPKA
ncbi:LPS export ABC transporter permease LptF [Algiphilus aromaticivorans]|uniref:LPS export ABC transporter permease LptF n=1 Tax=Algiphilus aromaticivorans TaxID=382454 RepID=UPI0005C19D58|nr:LPS export ABC transporter permease LptF [Algiphilus aromaticivorans]